MKYIIYIVILCFCIAPQAATKLNEVNFSFKYDPLVDSRDFDIAIKLRAQKRFASVFFIRDSAITDDSYTEKDVLLRPIYVRVVDYAVRNVDNDYIVDATVLISKSVLKGVLLDYVKERENIDENKRKSERLAVEQCLGIKKEIETMKELYGKLGISSDFKMSKTYSDCENR